MNQRGEPVVMDFGLARRNNSDDARLTKSGAVIGTPAYMPPEQIKGDFDAIGPCCDIYSLGVILYELLTGEIPFEGPIAAVLGQVLTQEPPPLSKFRADLDPRLEAVCLKMMAKEIENRYGTMIDVANALSEFSIKTASGGSSLSHSRQSKSPPPIRTSPSALPQSVGEGSLSASTEEAIPAPIRTRSTVGRRRKRQQKRRRKTNPTWITVAGTGGLLVVAAIVAYVGFGGNGESSQQEPDKNVASTDDGSQDGIAKPRNSPPTDKAPTSQPPLRDAEPLDMDLDLTDVSQAISFGGRHFKLSGDAIQTGAGVLIRESTNVRKETGRLTLVHRLLGDFDLEVQYHLERGNGVNDTVRVKACGVSFRETPFGDHKIRLFRKRDKLTFIHDLDPPREVTLVFPRTVVDTSVDIDATFNSAYSGRPKLTIRRLKLTTSTVSKPEGNESVFSLPEGPVQTIELSDDKKTAKFLQFSANPAAPTSHPAKPGQWTNQSDGVHLTGLTDVISKQEFRGDFIMTLDYEMTGNSPVHNKVRFEMWGHQFASNRKGHRNVILCRSGDTLYLCDGNEVLEFFTLPENARSQPSPVKMTLWHNWQFNNWPSMVIRRITLQGQSE
jgi:hypothetical protein